MGVSARTGRTGRGILLRWVVGGGGAPTAAPAQVSYQAQQPTQKLLVLPLTPKSAADSVFSIAVTDVAREKLAGMARYKVQVIPKPKLRSEEHTSELQSPCNLVCRLLLEKKKKHTHHALLTT